MKIFRAFQITSFPISSFTLYVIVDSSWNLTSGWFYLYICIFIPAYHRKSERNVARSTVLYVAVVSRHVSFWLVVICRFRFNVDVICLSQPPIIYFIYPCFSSVRLCAMRLISRKGFQGLLKSTVVLCYDPTCSWIRLIKFQASVCLSFSLFFKFSK